MKTRALVVVSIVALFAGTAQAAPIFYSAQLEGSIEFPPNASPGSGFALVGYDPVAHTMSYEVTFQDLVGATTAAHIHCCVDPFGTAGVATSTPSFPGFPLGVTSGVFNATFDLTQASSWNPAFITSSGGISEAEARLAAGLAAGQAYFNIHSTAYGGGEIRGFLQQVPEPGSLGLLAIAATSAFAFRRRRRAARN